MIIFSLMRMPWMLSYFKFIEYNPIIFYSYNAEVLVTPLLLSNILRFRKNNKLDNSKISSKK